jgi:hypothetical protein
MSLRRMLVLVTSRWAGATVNVARGTSVAVGWARLAVSRTSCCAAIGVAAALAGAQELSLCAGHKKRSQEADGAADRNDIYEVESIVNRRLVKGTVEYLIKWLGYPETDNSWEPLANLAGIEQELSEFEARQAKEISDYNAVIRAKQAKSQGQLRLVPGPPGGEPGRPARGGSAAQPPAAQPSIPAVEEKQPTAFTGKKKSPIWEQSLQSAKNEDEYICQEIVDTKTGKICGQCMVGKSGPSPLWTHHGAKHKRKPTAFTGKKKSPIWEQ